MVGSPATTGRAGLIARRAVLAVENRRIVEEATQPADQLSRCAIRPPAKRPAQNPLVGRRKRDWANDLLARLLYGGDCDHADCLETKG